MYHPPPPQDGMYHPADALQDYAACPPVPHASGPAEPDWTCPNCGNVNFGFRVTCNMRKCGAPKPGSAPTPPPRPRPAPSYPPAPAPYAPPPAYGGYGGPPPPHMAGGPPSYAPPSAIPPQYAPYPPAPAYDVNPAPSYGGYDMPPPAPAGYGGGYGGGRPPAMADGMMGGKRKGGAGSGGEGDWVCSSCGNTNFAFRKVCNMRRCGAPRPAHLDYLDHEPVVSRKFAKTDDGQPDGSWVCNACGNVNYPFRTKCNRRNCGAPKGSEPPQLQPPPPQLQQPPHVRAQEQPQAQVQAQGHVQVQPHAQVQPVPDRSLQPGPPANTNGGPLYPQAEGASDAGYAPPPYVGPGEVSELPVQSEAASQ